MFSVCVCSRRRGLNSRRRLTRAASFLAWSSSCRRYIYIYIYIYVYVYIYIYIYKMHICISLSLFLYTHIYIYIYMQNTITYYTMLYHVLTYVYVLYCYVASTNPRPGLSGRREAGAELRERRRLPVPRPGGAEASRETACFKHIKHVFSLN